MNRLAPLALLSCLVGLSLVDPAAAAPPPRWIEQAPAKPPRVLTDVTIVAIGIDAALARVTLVDGKRASVLLGTSERTGTVGPITGPKGTTWLGLGERDAVLAATKDGTLWRADDLIAAAAGTFAKVGKVAGARTWDASGALVVATAGKTLWLSTDGGVTFAKQVRPRGLDGAFVRDDGVVVADPKGAPPEVSRDRGATWTAAPAEVGELRVRRIGGWIGEREGDRCAPGARGCKSCQSAVLADDGVTWLAWPEWSRNVDKGADVTVVTPVLDVDAWTDRFSSGYGDPSAVRAIAPPLSTNKQLHLATARATCERLGPAGAFASIFGGPGGYRDCGGVDCLDRVLPDAPRGITRFVELRDRARTPGEPSRGLADAPADTTSRPRRIAIVDTRRLRLRLVSPPCATELVADLGGIAAVSCADGPLYLLDPAGTFHRQTAQPMRRVWATRNGNGTILVASDCYGHPETCQMQRKPSGPLEGGTWDDLGPASELRGFRLAPDGGVYAVRAPISPRDATAIDEVMSSLGNVLERHDHGELPSAFLKALGACHQGLAPAERQPGDISFTWQPGATRVGDLRTTSPGLRACFEQAAAKARLGAPKKARAITLSVRVPIQRGVIVGFGDGRSTPPAAIPFAFDGDLTALELDAQGPMVAISRNRRSTWFRVAADGSLTELPTKSDD